MAYKVPVPTGASDAAPVCLLPVAESWRHVLVGLLERALSDWFWSGTEDEVESANAEVAKWIDYLEECMSLDNVAIIEHRENSGVEAGSGVTGAWATRPLTDIVLGQSWVTLPGSNVLRLDAGTYLIDAVAAGRRHGRARIRLWDATVGAARVMGVAVASPDAPPYAGVTHHAAGRLALSQATDMLLQQFCETGGISVNFGAYVADGAPETYARITVRRV